MNAKNREWAQIELIDFCVYLRLFAFSFYSPLISVEKSIADKNDEQHK